MALKITYLFDFRSDPTDRQKAQSHNGGWSESIWQTADSPATDNIRQLAQTRALLLPGTARIIGYRAQQFTNVGSHLKAGGSSTALLGMVGPNGIDPDQPQSALSMVATSAGNSNTRRFTIRAIADSQIVGGEWQPSPVYEGFLTRYRNSLIQGEWVFPARDFTVAVHDIESIAAGVLKLVGAPAGYAVGDRVLLKKCKDVNGNPVVGTFKVLAVAGANITLGGMDLETEVLASGQATRVVIAFRDIDDVQVGRAVVRKIGRPFEQYRGRASKRR
jgi:hypothetical protein